MVEILDQLIDNFEIYCIESVFLRSFLPLRFLAWPPAFAASFNRNAEPPGINLPQIPEVSSFPSTPVAQSTDRVISQVVEQFTWFQGGTIRKDSTFALWGLHFQCFSRVPAHLSAQSQEYITPRVSAKANPWNVSMMVGKSDNVGHLPTF